VVKSVRRKKKIIFVEEKRRKKKKGRAIPTWKLYILLCLLPTLFLFSESDLFEQQRKKNQKQIWSSNTCNAEKK
jgi:hypothetical protein